VFITAGAAADCAAAEKLVGGASADYLRADKNRSPDAIPLLLLRYLSHAPGSEGFLAQDEERHASGDVTKYCVKKTSYMPYD
jgi:hypothetical protein